MHESAHPSMPVIDLMNKFHFKNMLMIFIVPSWFLTNLNQLFNLLLAEMKLITLILIEAVESKLVFSNFW
jgi:hypothetical protein